MGLLNLAVHETPSVPETILWLRWLEASPYLQGFGLVLKSLTQNGLEAVPLVPGIRPSLESVLEVGDQSRTSAMN